MEGFSALINAPDGDREPESVLARVMESSSLTLNAGVTHLGSVGSYGSGCARVS